MKALKLLGLLALLVAVAVGSVAISQTFNLVNAFGSSSERHDSQVVISLTRTQEVALLSLGIQGIKEETRKSGIFGIDLPGTSNTVFLQYNFNAKLGVKGSDVKVSQTGDKAYTIKVPQFVFIGYTEPTFKVAATDGGALSWITPDVDQVKMVSDILNSDQRQTYVDKNVDILKDQARVFYTNVVTGIDPAVKLTFEFAS